MSAAPEGWNDEELDIRLDDDKPELKILKEGWEEDDLDISLPSPPPPTAAAVATAAVASGENMWADDLDIDINEDLNMPNLRSQFEAEPVSQPPVSTAEETRQHLAKVEMERPSIEQHLAEIEEEKYSPAQISSPPLVETAIHQQSYEEEGNEEKYSPAQKDENFETALYENFPVHKVEISSPPPVEKGIYEPSYEEERPLPEQEPVITSMLVLEESPIVHNPVVEVTPDIEPPAIHNVDEEVPIFNQITTQPSKLNPVEERTVLVEPHIVEPVEMEYFASPSDALVGEAVNPLDKLTTKKKPVSPIIANLTGWFSTVAEMTSSGMERLYENVVTEPSPSPSTSPVSRAPSVQSIRAHASDALHSLVKRAQQQGSDELELGRRVPLPVSPDSDSKVPLFGALSVLERLGKSTATHAAALARDTIAPAVKQALLLDAEEAHDLRDLERNLDDLFEAMGASAKLEAYAIQSCEHAKLMKAHFMTVKAAEFQRLWSIAREIRVLKDSSLIIDVGFGELLAKVCDNAAIYGDLIESGFYSCVDPVETVERILAIFPQEDHRQNAQFQQSVLLYSLRTNFVRLLITCIDMVIPVINPF